MANEPITRSEATVLIDERIQEHDEKVDAPKHRESIEIVKALTAKVDAIADGMTKMVATFDITMKFGGAGIIIWSIKQLAEMVQTLRH